jgi:hypothetical protein
MTSRVIVLAFCAGLLCTALTPLDTHIGDSISKVNAALGKRFEMTPAMKMTDATRRYQRPDGKIYVSFKDQKVCLLYYVAPFTQEDALALLTREAPAEQWKLDRTHTTKYGTMRSYHTTDNRLMAHIADGRSVIICTREVDY